MTVPITLSNLVNLTNQTTAVTTINDNSAAITTAFGSALDTSGDQMKGNLDMNSNRILNLPVAISDGEPLRLGDITDFTQFQNSVDLSAALAQAQANATTATTQAGIATTQATNSATSATSAANSATAAATSASQAALFASSNYTNIFAYIPTNQQAAIQAGTSTFDAGPSINTAIAANAATGNPIFFPYGTYVIQTQLKYINSASSGLCLGPQLIGAGMLSTTFDNQIAGVQLTNAFSTTNGSVIVTLTWPNHGKSVNDVITLINLGSHSYGGLDMEGDWGVTSVTTNTLTFNHYASATVTISNTGSATVTKAMMYFDTAGAFMEGTLLRDFRTISTTNPVGSSAIKIRRGFNTVLDHIWIDGAVADGIHFPCVLGDVDSTAGATIRNCRLDNCGRWGLLLAASSTTVAGVLTGHNEISNITLKDVSVNSCGSVQTSYLYGGGLKWKGQCISLSNVAIVTCSNCGIYVQAQAGAGTPSVFNFDILVLENNTGRNFVIEALDTMVGGTLEIYNNDSFISTTGLWLNTNPGSINNINIQSSIIRATAGNNNYTAFVGSGIDLGTAIRIYTPSFQDFGHAGQTQASGITFKT